MFFKKDLKFNFSEFKKIINVAKYWIKIKIPVTLIDNKKALKKDINKTSRYLSWLPSVRLLNILIDT